MKRGRVLDNFFVDTFLRDPNQFQALPNVEQNSTCPDHSNLCILFQNDYPCGACVTSAIRNLFDWAKCNTSWEKTHTKVQKCPVPEEEKKILFQTCKGGENECLCPVDKWFRVCQTTSLEVVGEHILQVAGCIGCIHDAADAKQFRNCSRIDQTQLRFLFPDNDYKDVDGLSGRSGLEETSNNPNPEKKKPFLDRKTIIALSIGLPVASISLCLLVICVKKCRKKVEGGWRIGWEHGWRVGDYAGDLNEDYGIYYTAAQWFLSS